MGSYQPKALGNSLLKEFPIDRTFRNLNHGSFGTYPIAILNKFRELQDKFEASPDRFLRFELAFYLLESRKALSSLLNTPVNSTVFVKNATTGVNTVLRNLVYHPGDIIVYFSTVYGAVEKLIASLAETTPVRARKVNYEFPISHDELVQRFMDTVTKARSEGLNVRIAVFDTIVSSPGIRLPWLFVPRGCAVFYVPQRNQHLIRTTVPTSHGFVPVPRIMKTGSELEEDGPFAKPIDAFFAQSDFELQFEFIGTNDDLPYLCVPDAMKYRQEVCGGEEKIMQYCQTLAFEAGNRVARIWGTDVLSEFCSSGGHLDVTKEKRSEFRKCAFANVRLPITLVDDQNVPQGRIAKAEWPVVRMADAVPTCRAMEQRLVLKHSTMSPCYVHAGSIWTRLSAQVYLEVSDFEWLASVFKKIFEELAIEGSMASLDINPKL
ncbi:Pyridoxal phosphate-dependent transferase, major region, subdomain 1 [Trichophyton rubrum]|nr:Pyridoxal phosphate-dependent transferase, major region, subdomain 1 [Trichophyton rubrum]